MGQDSLAEREGYNAGAMSIPNAPKPPSPATHFLAVFPSIMLPMFLAVIDQTIIAAALPAIASDFGNVDALSWVVVSYLIAATIAAPVYGRLGDAFGRRRLLLSALVIFLLASICCAFAPSIEALIVARGVQGLGGGGLMTLSQALIGEAVKGRDRSRYQGYLSAVAVTSNTLGPVLGGFLTQHFGWPSIFLINLPLGCLAIVLVLQLPVRTGRGSFRFDGPGIAFFALFVGSLLLLIDRVPRIRSVGWPEIALLALLTVLALALLIRREARAPDPLLPIPLLRHPSIWRADALAIIHGAMLVPLMTFLPLYFRVQHGTSASQIGMLLVPMMVGIGVGSMTTGWLVSHFGRTTLFPGVGLALVVLTFVGAALFADSMPAFYLSMLFGVSALFMGTVMGVVQVTVQAAAGAARLGTAAATVQLSRSLGAALGTAAAGSLLLAVTLFKAPEAADQLVALLEVGPDTLAQLPSSEALAIRDALASGFQAIFLMLAAWAAIGVTLVWTIPMRRI